MHRMQSQLFQTGRGDAFNGYINWTGGNFFLYFLDFLRLVWLPCLLNKLPFWHPLGVGGPNMGCNPGNGMIMNHGGHGGGPMSGGGGHHNQHQPFRPGGGSGGMRPGGGQMGGGGGHGGQNGGFSNFCMQNNINTGFNGSNMMNPGGSGKMFVSLSQRRSIACQTTVFRWDSGKLKRL